MEELFRMTLLLREQSQWLSGRFSENKENYFAGSPGPTIDQELRSLSA
jgi:hypothetical protein